MSLALGAIADDFTGATDLASMLARGGLRTELVLGRPGPDTPPSGADAVVVALKSRTAPLAEAIADSVESWRWCAAAGATRCYFKYCSTFDSTAEGNIGPVAEALMVATGATRTLYTPAFPENGRSIYMGKLFVGQMLLSESGMRNHPLTPMTDADLPRTLAPQLSEGARTGLVPWPTVRAGAAAVAAELDRLESAGIAHVVVDALDQSDLDALAEAVRDWPLVTAGSGLGLSLGRLLGTSAESEALPAVGGP
ncbi:MAG: four-carbon acid sugar kinase family protein, partial [Pseudomonadota bacterium]